MAYRCFSHEISKALQLTNLEKLGLPYPKAAGHSIPSQALEAAEAISYPVVIKPNIGGSGAGIERSIWRRSCARPWKRTVFTSALIRRRWCRKRFTARDGIINAR